MGRYELDEALVEKAGLTARQRECLELHLRGASYRYIAKQLGIRHVVVIEHVQKAIGRLSDVLAPDERAA